MAVKELLKQKGAHLGEKSPVTVDYCVLNNNKTLEVVKLIADGGKHISDPGRVIVIQDQVIPPNSPQESSSQRMLAGFAEQAGAKYHYGTGMASHLLLDQYVKKGDIAVSADRDILMLGAAGAMGICLGPAKLAQAAVYGKVIIPQPDIYRVRLSGRLPGNVDIRAAAMMLAAEVERELKDREVSAVVIEFCQDDEVNLSMAEKAVLCGWMQKTGVMSALMAEQDGQTPDYSFDLAKTVPVITGPAGYKQKVRAVYIGGAYGGYLEDIKVAAEQLRGRKLAYKVRLTVSPATAEIYAKAADLGYLSDIMDAGGMVINQCGSPAVQARIGEHEVMVSNDIHNEKGYAGPESSQICLTTTAGAIACAISGAVSSTVNSSINGG